MSDITQNGSLARDDNDSPVMGGTSSADDGAIVNSAFNPITRALLIEHAGSEVTLVVGTTTITGGTTTRILYDNAGVLGEYTISGTGTVVAMATSPAFITPSLGVATATSINGLTITTTTGTLTLANGSTLATSGANSITLTSTGATNVTLPTTGTLMTNPMTTGGDIIYGGASGVPTRLANGSAGQVLQSNGTTLAPTWVAAGSGTVTTVSVVTANGFAGTVATDTTTPAITLSTTITGSLYGNGTAISASKLALTQPATGSTLTIVDGKTLTASNTLTFTGTDGSSVAFGTGGTVLYSASVIPLTIGTTTISSGTTTRILYDNAGVLGEYVTTSLATASAVAIRDGNANIFFNNVLANGTSTVSAGGTTVLTVASSRYQALTGSSAQTFQLPDATTLSLGPWFVFNNNSSQSLTITNNGGSTIYTVPAGGIVQIGPTSIGTANGTWDVHGYFPSTVTWSSGVTGLVMNTALTTTPTILAGASSSTAPSFIPQRTASTTGFGGDGTNLFATIGGTAYLKIASGSVGPNANDATALGVSGTAFSDLFLASGGVINWLAGDATITHSSGLLTSNVPIAVAQIYNGNNAITASGNAATVTRANRVNTVTNNSAATLTITMSTTSASAVDMVIVRVLDASAVAQTITWVNTENSTVTAPTTSNGSTTLPLTVGFMWNASTSLWRCVAKA